MAAINDEGQTRENFETVQIKIEKPDETEVPVTENKVASESFHCCKIAVDPNFSSEMFHDPTYPYCRICRTDCHRFDTSPNARLHHGDIDFYNNHRPTMHVEVENNIVGNLKVKEEMPAEIIVENLETGKIHYIEVETRRNKELIEKTDHLGHTKDKGNEMTKAIGKRKRSVSPTDQNDFPTQLKVRRQNETCMYLCNDFSHTITSSKGSICNLKKHSLSDRQIVNTDGSDQTAVKRTLSLKSIKDKYQALTLVEKGEMTKTAIAKHFQVPLSTLSTWIKYAEKIKSAYLQSLINPNRKHIRIGKSEETEKALLKWYAYTLAQNKAVNGQMLLAKAKEFSRQLDKKGFIPTPGWLDRFKHRYQISLKKPCRRTSPADENKCNFQKVAFEKWTSHINIILEEYQPKDIFNADEFGLFFRSLPENVSQFKTVNCDDGKFSCERLTVLLCANMIGTEKLPLTVIGKWEKPRCFKNIHSLPTDYHAQSRAWITSDIFREWLLKLDHKFHTEKRKVAMIIDNCPAHQIIKELKAISVFHVPSDNTNKLQPMELGIIHTLKVHYRKRVLAWFSNVTDDEIKQKFSILDSLSMLKDAWASVEPSTISICFDKSGFKVNNASTSEEDTIKHLQDLPNDYIRFDDSLPVSGPLIDEDIIHDIVATRELNSNIDTCSHTEEVTQTLTDVPTAKMALDACNILVEYLKSKNDTDNLLIGLLPIKYFALKDDLVGNNIVELNI